MSIKPLHLPTPFGFIPYLQTDYSTAEYDSEKPTGAYTYLLPKVLKLLPETPATVLDVGCGNGFIAYKIAEKGHQVLAVDSSIEGIMLASCHYAGRRNLKFEVCSLREDLTQIAPNGVDIVVSTEVIEHLTQPQLLLQNAYKVLKPGGTLILTTPYHGYWKNLALSLANGWDRHFSVDWVGGHLKFFSEKSLSRMLFASGFHRLSFHNAGRVWGLWKSLVCRAHKPL